MATRNETHVHDLSTLTNFKDWAKAVHDALIAFGWTNTADTGQVNWSTIAAVADVFEIFQPGDALTAFYVRIDYVGVATGFPQIKMQIGTGTNGSGTLTGITLAQWVGSSTGNSGATKFNCLFCGTNASFSIMMWRDLNASGNCLFAVDRSKDANGNDTGGYVTLFGTTSGAGILSYQHQSLVFGVGAAPQIGPYNVGGSGGWGWNTPIGQGGASTGKFGGNTAFSPVFPFIGYHDNPTLAVACLASVDLFEYTPVSTTLYGAVHKFIFSKNRNLGFNPGAGILMRWE